MTDTRIRLMEAIAGQRLVTTRYNGSDITLAPHLMFERNGDLFVVALNLSKNWRSEDEQRLGQFKLAGLGATTLLEDGFEPLASYQPVAPHADATVILAI